MEFFGKISNVESIDQLKREVENDLNDAIQHGMLVSILARRLSCELGKPKEFCSDMAIAGLLHDIGKMKLSRYLYWRSDDVLDDEEMKYVRMHSTLSYQILREHDYSKRILDAIHFHHENFDGSGYPNNLKGVSIPEGARILRVCDVFAALISNRPYRSAFDIDTAMILMIEEVKNFDMKIFLAFQRMVNADDFVTVVYNAFMDKDEEIGKCIHKYLASAKEVKEPLNSEKKDDSEIDTMNNINDIINKYKDNRK
jgi:putative nucleotidyltransferase with HDIG domain